MRTPERLQDLRQFALFVLIPSFQEGRMGQIERGESNLTLSTLLVIAEKLETTVSGLFEEIA